MDNGENKKMDMRQEVHIFVLESTYVTPREVHVISHEKVELFSY